MLKLIFLAALVAVSFASRADKGRIVNGTNASPGEIPYIVSLQYIGSHTCGASILDKWHVLTAAHCVHGRFPNLFSIKYGITKLSTFGHVIPALFVVYHEDYNPNNAHINDIAIVTLLTPLRYGDDVQPVVLPPSMQVPPAGAVGVLAGWGLPYTGGSAMNDLQRVNLITYSDVDCKAAHSTVNALYHMCAGVPEGGKGQCSGDSGGPYVVNGVQVGIVSWSVKPCAVKGYPGVYCRVSSFIEWIAQHM